MTLTEWLNSPLYRGESVTAGARLAELIAVNGGSSKVSGWGCISGGGIYGRTGLEMEEALQLLYLSGVVDGALLAGEEQMGTVHAILQMHWRAQEELIAASAPSQG